jgi:hypothetical protein
MKLAAGVSLLPQHCCCPLPRHNDAATETKHAIAREGRRIDDDNNNNEALMAAMANPAVRQPSPPILKARFTKEGQQGPYRWWK